MFIRPLYLGCFSYRRDLVNGRSPSQEVWGFVNPRHIGAIATAKAHVFFLSGLNRYGAQRTQEGRCSTVAIGV
jgi:hypothetical protein